MFAAVLSAVLMAAPGPANLLEPWAKAAQPGDEAKSHVEEISKTGHAYTVVHGGNVDGESCRTPVGCGINREPIIDQSWQSNRAVWTCVEKCHHSGIAIGVKDPEPLDRFQCHEQIALPFRNQGRKLVLG